jgi:hypothetical protein
MKKQIESNKSSQRAARILAEVKPSDLQNVAGGCRSCSMQVSLLVKA